MKNNKTNLICIRTEEYITVLMMKRRDQLGHRTISEYVRSLIYEDLDIDPKKSNNKENESEVN